MAKKVGVLMGGMSSEREVSLNSGANVADALKQAGYDVFTIDVTADIPAFIKTIEREKPDVLFNALHGKYGEDGCIQGLLDLMQIPYTHSGRLASALAMNKDAARKIYQLAGIPVAKGRVVGKADILAGDVLPRPYVLKPISDGSSVGAPQAVRHNASAALRADASRRIPAFRFIIVPPQSVVSDRVYYKGSRSACQSARRSESI